MALLPRWYLFTRLERTLAETSRISAILFGSWVPRRSRKGQSSGRTTGRGRGFADLFPVVAASREAVREPSMMTIRADIIALLKETECLLSEIVGTEAR
jgi:hypothetical protein